MTYPKAASELKSCPFCGGEMAAIKPAYSRGWWRYGHADVFAAIEVGCPISTQTFGNINFKKKWFVDGWNARVTKPYVYDTFDA